MIYKLFLSLWCLISVIFFSCSSNDGDEDSLRSMMCDDSIPPDLGDSVQITFIGNQGVLIFNSKHKVLIDALANFTGYSPVKPGELEKIVTGEGIYCDIDAVMITHFHGDHYSFGSVKNFLDNHPNSEILVTPQVRDNLTINGVDPDRLHATSPALNESQSIMLDDLKVTVYNLKHFEFDGMDYSDADNFAYLISIGNKEIIHFGDVSYEESNLATTGIAESGGVDIAILPVFDPLITEMNKDAIMRFINPRVVIAAHLKEGPVPTEEILSVYPNAVVFDNSLESVRY